jgi:soluble lytic murein transglycosylase-like protein
LPRLISGQVARDLAAYFCCRALATAGPSNRRQNKKTRLTKVMTNMKLKLFAAVAAAVLAVSSPVLSAPKSPYDKIIAKYARTYGVPVSLAHAVIRVESNYKAKARGRAGEIGLMQLKLQTARGLGYRGSAKGLYHPATNIRYGMAYLGQARKLGGRSVCGTILKYNAGHYAKRMNPVSAKYCSKVKKHLRG